MSDNAAVPVFWLPSVLRADEVFNGALTMPGEIDLGSGATGAAGRKWLGALQMDRERLLSFLDEINPALTTLLLAGHAVSYIEMAFEDAPAVRATLESGHIDHVLRVDLKQRRVELNLRSDPDHLAGKSYLRLGIEPASQAAAALPLSQSDADAFCAARAGVAEFSRPVTQWMDECFGPDMARREGVNPPAIDGHTPSSGTSVLQHRLQVLDDILIDWPTGAGEVTSRPYLVFGPQSGTPDRHADGARLRESVLGFFRHSIFGALRWYVGERLAEAAEAAIDAHETALLNAPDDASRVEMRSVPPDMPGLLPVLVPRNWVPSANRPLSEDEQTWLDFLSDIATRVSRRISSPGWVWAQDYPGTDTAAPYPLKQHGLLDLSGWTPHLLREEGAPALPIEPATSADPSARIRQVRRFLDLSLVGVEYFDRKKLKDANKDKADPGETVTPALRGLLDGFHTLIEEGEVTPDDGLEVVVYADGSSREEFRQFYKHFRQLAKARNPDAKFGQPHAAVQHLRHGVYIDSVLTLFNLGIFESALVAPPLEGPLNRPHVFAERVAGGALAEIQLKHTGYPSINGLRLLHVHPLGYSLDDSVAWEFIPAPALDTSSAMRAALDGAVVGAEDGDGDDGLYQAAIQQIAAALGQMKDRLLIVAAPGVQIVGLPLDHDSNWPSTCEIEVFRVQNHGQVPGAGEHIQTEPYSAPMATMAFDDLEPMLDETRDLDGFVPRFQANPEQHPVVHVTPFRGSRNSVNAHGVKASYRVGDASHSRGVNGDTDVWIYFDPRSPEARFALDFRYRILSRQRVTGQTSQMVEVFNPQDGETYITEQFSDVWEPQDIIQFEIVVHKTDDVLVQIKDNNMGWIADYMPESIGGGEVAETVVYSIFDGPIDAIRPNGQVLETLMPPDALASWTDYAALNTTLVVTHHETDESVIFTRDNRPIEQVHWAAWQELGMTVTDTLVGFIPVFGDAADATEFLIAMTLEQDRWGRPVTNMQKGVLFACIFVPFVGGHMFRALLSGPGSEIDEVVSTVIENTSRRHAP